MDFARCDWNRTEFRTAIRRGESLTLSATLKGSRSCNNPCKNLMPRSLNEVFALTLSATICNLSDTFVDWGRETTNSHESTRMGSGNNSADVKKSEIRYIRRENIDCGRRST